jgi:gliding motility-associated lipoprotein GldD
MQQYNKVIFKIATIALLVASIACNSTFVPKPRGYFAVPLPQHQYLTFSKPGYPYTFSYPVYATITQDSTFFENKPENPWWINVNFPQFSGTIYISYKSLQNNDFSKMVNDAFKMTYKHTTKATAINDSLMTTPNGIHGVYFTVAGNAATGKQFFLSDTAKHFLRGALYFDTTPNEDSLAPVSNFLQKDLEHLINTFKWK